MHRLLLFTKGTAQAGDQQNLGKSKEGKECHLITGDLPFEKVKFPRNKGHGKESIFLACSLPCLYTKILAQTEGARTQNSAESKRIPGCKIT